MPTMPGMAPGGGAWTGMVDTRWYLAEEGVRRSKRRRCESEETAEMRAGFEGQNEVLYVQLPMGSVLMEKFLVGDHCFVSVVLAGYFCESIRVLRCVGRIGGRGAYDFDCAVPGAGNKCVFSDGVPADGKGLALVFVKVHDGKVVDAEVKELEGAIAACDNELILVDFGPGEVVERVICVEAGEQ